MACPHVSGAAALILGDNPLMKPSAVLEEMLNTAYQNELSGLKFDDTNSLLCVAEGGAPQPEPTPAPAPGTWVVSGSGCAIDGECIQSNNHPGDYGNSEQCNVKLYGDFDLTFEAFNTERRYDWLTVGGTRYSGDDGPSNGRYSGSISWTTDRSVTRSGWKVCKTDSSLLEEAVAGGCTGAGDRQVIRNKFNSLVSDVRGCVLGCVGRGSSCTNSCVERMGFTSGCARCVGGLGECAKSNCMWYCWRPSSQGCTDCTVSKCYGNLVRCSGLPQSELP